MRIWAFGACFLGIAVLAGWAAAGKSKPVVSAAESAPKYPPPWADGHDFGTKAVEVVGSIPPGGGNMHLCLEQAKMRGCLHQQFLVGKVVAVGDAPATLVGKTVWTSLNCVFSITEHETVEAMKKHMAEQQQGKAAPVAAWSVPAAIPTPPPSVPQVQVAN